MQRKHKKMKIKKTLLSVLALLALTFSGFSQTLPSYLPANGLVGWWPFNGNANDESGNNNNGIVDGTTLTADRFGNQSQAFLNTAQSHKIALPTISADSIDLISVTGWFKKSSSASGSLQDGTIFGISNGCNGTDGLRLFVGLDNFIYWTVEKTSCFGVSVFNNQINF
jgi:hypothetical protein